MDKKHKNTNQKYKKEEKKVRLKRGKIALEVNSFNKSFIKSGEKKI